MHGFPGPGGYMCAMVRPLTVTARGTLAAAALLLTLTACTGEPDAEAGASPSASPSGTTSQQAERDAPLTANQACAAMYVEEHGADDLTLEERVGDALVGAAGGLTGTSADEMHALAVELGRLETRVPEEFREPVQQVRVPFLQLQEGLDLGAQQQIELDIASTVEGLKAFEKLC